MIEGVRVMVFTPLSTKFQLYRDMQGLLVEESDKLYHLAVFRVHDNELGDRYSSNLKNKTIIGQR